MNAFEILDQLIRETEHPTLKRMAVRVRNDKLQDGRWRRSLPQESSAMLVALVAAEVNSWLYDAQVDADIKLARTALRVWVRRQNVTPDFIV